jgi:hypothetical protein
MPRRLRAMLRTAFWNLEQQFANETKEAAKWGGLDLMRKKSRIKNL